MTLFDVFITIVYIILIYIIAFTIRAKLTDKTTRPYFITGLTVKMIGAISLGLIFFYYYGNGSYYGDTFVYFNGGKIIADHFKDSPTQALSVILGDTKNGVLFLNTHNKIVPYRFYSGPSEFFIIRVSALLNFFSFGSYYPIAIFFSIFGFSGLFSLYNTLLRMYPNLYKQLAYSTLFIPSVFFWGSGLLKDTISLGALGLFFYSFFNLFIRRNFKIAFLFILIFSFYIVYQVKIYIILCFLPPLLVWLSILYNNRIKNRLLKFMFKPFLLSLGLLTSYLGLVQISSLSTDYQLDMLVSKAEYQAYHLKIQTQIDKGSLYDIGTLEGGLSNIMVISLKAINVTLFRPYLWEAKNIVMLLSSLESTVLLFFTVILLFKGGALGFFTTIARNPILILCFSFSLLFAIAVGVTSGNFGTLVRYKIPLLPFYLSGLFIVQYLNPHKARKQKKH